jgi:transposase InsO family protein
VLERSAPLEPRRPENHPTGSPLRACNTSADRKPADQSAAEAVLRALLSIGPEPDLIYRGVNAMAEAFNSLYKWELIYPQGPWTGLDDVEFATLGYIDWFNHGRLHGEITDDNTYVTPAEFEATYYRQAAPALAGITQ